MISQTQSGKGTFFIGSLSRVGVKYFSGTGMKIPVPVYVKAKKIRFLKFEKLRYPKAFPLNSSMERTLGREEGFG